MADIKKTTDSQKATLQLKKENIISFKRTEIEIEEEVTFTKSGKIQRAKPRFQADKVCNYCKPSSRKDLFSDSE